MEFLANNIDMLSLIGLIIAIIISMWKDINLGIIALGMAFIIGHLIGGISVNELISYYPSGLLLKLMGVTFLFGIAQVNGTLEKFTGYAIKMVKGKVALLPIVLFFVAFVIASLGPGQISSSALVAGPSMALAAQVGIPPLLMALVVGNGAQAGAMSPMAPNGIVGNSVLADMGIEGAEMLLWGHMLIAHIIIAALAYTLFGGVKLWKNSETAATAETLNMHIEPWTYQQKITVIAIALLVLGVVAFNLDVGFWAFVLNTLLLIGKAGDEKAAIKTMPWGAMIMVTGVTVLVKLMQGIGGIDLIVDVVARISSPLTVTLVVGFFSGIMSAYASTSGFIMPAFLPMAPLILERIGAPSSDLMGLLLTIVVAGHLTDMSPLSTTGAVFISSAPATVDTKPLYKGMMLWGLSMSVFGAILCWILYTLIGIA